MAAGDLYIQTVIDYVPQGLPLRDQIAMELRTHITERLEHGQPLDDVQRQLGDPLKLAESYLASEPLEGPRFWPRTMAKIIDFAIVLAGAVLLGCLLWITLPGNIAAIAFAVGVGVLALGFAFYTAFAEYRSGRTIGKRLVGIRVVRESGARITLGQSLLRQLPLLTQIFVIDALFALFTKKKQRAFELITKTRAVVVLQGQGR